MFGDHPAALGQRKETDDVFRAALTFFAYFLVSRQESKDPAAGAVKINFYNRIVATCVAPEGLFTVEDNLGYTYLLVGRA